MANEPAFTPEQFRQLLRYEPDTGKLFWKSRTAEMFTVENAESFCRGWNSKFSGKEAFTYKSKRGYCVSNISRVLLSAHRVGWAIYYGEHPSGQIDHINGVKTDNRIVNLRDVTHAENARNMAMTPRNTSGVSGVYLHRQTGKWCAQIAAFGKTIGLGLFSEKSDAIIARKAAERVLNYHPNHGRTAGTQDQLARAV